MVSNVFSRIKKGVDDLASIVDENANNIDATSTIVSSDDCNNTNDERNCIPQTIDNQRIKDPAFICRFAGLRESSNSELLNMG